MRTSYRTLHVALALTSIVLLASVADAQQGTATAGAPAFLNRQEGDYVIKNYRFRSGGTLPEVRLHFTTVGTPLRDASGKIRNGVIIMHGSSGNSSQVLAASFIGPLIGPGQPLDQTKHFLIFPDAVGNAKSTAPSDGLRAKFPKYGYLDMVDLEHRLITEHFGIDRLRIVMGISMGGMHSWLWGELYPDKMDAIVALSSLPVKISGRNLMWRRTLSNAIRTDPAWNGGNYTEKPRGFLNIMPMFEMLVQSPLRLAESLQTYDQADEAVRDGVEEAEEEDDANNILYRFEASFDYNPGPDLGKITAPAFAILFEDDTLNPPELGVIEREMPKIRNGSYVMIPAGPTSRGHRGQVHAVMWREHLAKFLATVPPLPADVK